MALIAHFADSLDENVNMCEVSPSHFLSCWLDLICLLEIVTLDLDFSL